MQSSKKWQTYEEVAAQLIKDLAGEFGLSDVEGKQILQGRNTTWEVDGKGISERDQSIIVIECKRWLTKKPGQAELARLAYTIKDLRASGGLYVSPIGLQQGAKTIAEAEKVIEVTLDAESTITDMTLELLKKTIIRKSVEIISGIRLVIQGESPTNEDSGT